MTFKTLNYSCGAWSALCGIACVVLTAVPAPAVADEGAMQKATLVITNAKLWTGTVPDARSRKHDDQLQDIFVCGDQIIAIKPAGKGKPPPAGRAQIVDADGRRVIPGITDSHTHVVSGGLQLERLHLRDVANRAEFLAAVEAAAKKRRAREWVLGGCWTTESWPDTTQPTRHWLDPITGDVPVFLTRMDGHQALVNSAALRIAGIDADRPSDPVGGEIQRDPETGEPTGILKESAMGLMEKFIPAPSGDARYAALLRAMKHANSLGVTSVHDMSEPEDLDAFVRAHEDGRLTLRVTSYVSVPDWENWLERVSLFPVRDNKLTVAGFKGYMDGSLGSRTAYMREAFRDAGPASKYPRGQLSALAVDHEKFREIVRLVDNRKLQIALHAIGDEANHLALNAYEFARKNGGAGGPPHRIEHVQHLHLSDIPRFAKMRVVASMQPYHKADDARYAEEAIGTERLKGSYAFRQLIDAGALICFGSDWPVVTLNPFAGIRAAVHAKTVAGKVWLPSHSLSLDEALYAYTAAPAKAIGREKELGSIVPGMQADLVILQQDPFAQDVQLSEITVDQTILAGRVVYDGSKDDSD